MKIYAKNRTMLLVCITPLVTLISLIHYSGDVTVGQHFFDKDALPVVVGSTVVYVVTTDKMPEPLKRDLQGISTLLVVDRRGQLVRSRDVVYQSLLAYHVARTHIDDPTNPGWDTKRAEKTAVAYQDAANTFRRIRISQNLIALSDESAMLGARLLVLSVVPQPPIAAASSTVKALLDPVTDPKQVARLLLSADLIASEAMLRMAASHLRSIRSYPLNSRVAPGLIMADMVAFPMGSSAALARVDLEESDPLWTPIKTALEQLKGILASSRGGMVRIADDAYDIGKRIFNLLKQTKNMGSYLVERERMVRQWHELMTRYQKISMEIEIIVKKHQQ